ncbi:hypothetical protein PAXINDRAFT_16331 [Paxillus involutus ATCC 200175]|uniref:Ubiquitin-like protease family profile domain-containing protein n=1 Tax=Paxillus involutus ATCC 200175 TaxID=664439 RepID=A0A0C9T4Y2_PAXIN|nr:hypothetical protein PAXINDRAFT_16331 [Paxillus involutus ATCC 200175]
MSMNTPPSPVCHSFVDLDEGNNPILNKLLTVPACFSSNIPSHSLSVSEFLNLPLAVALDTSTLVAISFSKMLPPTMLPHGFVSHPVPPYTAVSSLLDLACGMWQSGHRSIIHQSFHDHPLPLWVLPYLASMSHALEHQQDWRASHSWVLHRLRVSPESSVESKIISDVRDVLECLPWDIPLEGVGAETDLRTSGLRPLLASSQIGGRLLDTMVAAVINEMQAANSVEFDAICVEPLCLSDTLQSSNQRWRNYQTDRAFTRLRAIGSALHDGSLRRVLFPINIRNVHWAVIEVDTTHHTISYADSLDWSWPSQDIDAVQRWLGLHGFAPFNKATTLECGKQLDQFSCGVAAINTIRHSVFRDPIFSDGQSFCLRMKEFLNIVDSHLELSNPSSTLAAYHDQSDIDPLDNLTGSFDSDITKLELPSYSYRMVQSSSPPTQSPISCTKKPHLNLRAPEAEHLRLTWTPSPLEHEEQDRSRNQQQFNHFERAHRKRENAAERKQKQRAREKVAKAAEAAKAKPTVDSVLRHGTPPPPTISIAEGHKCKREDPTDAVRVNWQSPLLWPTIIAVAARVGYGMSPVEIEWGLKQVDPIRFSGICAQVIGTWIDRSGAKPTWKSNVVARAERGSIPSTHLLHLLASSLNIPTW